MRFMLLPMPNARATEGVKGVQAVLANNALPLATAVPLVNVRSSGMDRSESTLLGMGNVTGGLF